MFSTGLGAAKADCTYETESFDCTGKLDTISHSQPATPPAAASKFMMSTDHSFRTPSSNPLFINCPLHPPTSSIPSSMSRLVCSSSPTSFPLAPRRTSLRPSTSVPCSSSLQKDGFAPAGPVSPVSSPFSSPRFPFTRPCSGPDTADHHSRQQQPWRHLPNPCCHGTVSCGYHQPYLRQSRSGGRSSSPPSGIPGVNRVGYRCNVSPSTDECQQASGGLNHSLCGPQYVPCLASRHSSAWCCPSNMKQPTGSPAFPLMNAPSGQGISLFPLISSPAPCWSPYYSASSPASAFSSFSVRPSPPFASSVSPNNPPRCLRLHLSTPKSNCSLLMAAAALAAVAAVVEETSTAPLLSTVPPSIGDIKLSRRRRRGSVTTTATPFRFSKRRHTVHSDATTADTEVGDHRLYGTSRCVRLTEKAIVEHGAFYRNCESGEDSPKSRIEEEEDGIQTGTSGDSPATQKSITFLRKTKMIPNAVKQTPDGGKMSEMTVSGIAASPTFSGPPPFMQESTAAVEQEITREWTRGGVRHRRRAFEGNIDVTIRRRRVVGCQKFLTSISETTTSLTDKARRLGIRALRAQASMGDEEKLKVQQQIKATSSGVCGEDKIDNNDKFLKDLHSHSKLLYLYSAFHLLILVFNGEFYTKLNGSFTDRLADNTGPRYGAEDWSYYKHMHVALPTFMKSSIAWAVVYSLLIRCAIAVCGTGRKRLCTFARRVYGLWCSTCLLVNLSVFVWGGMMSKLVFFPDIWIGSCIEVLWYHSELFGAFSTVELLLFGAGLFIDLVGLVTLTLGAYWHLRSLCDTLLPVVCISAVLAVGSYFMAENPSCNSSDHHWVDFTLHQRNIDVLMGDSPNYNPLRFPVYLTMTDGVKIAVDVYLPNNYIEGFRNTSAPASFPALPTYLEITRYDRRMTVLWPFTMLRIWKEPRDSSVNVWSWQFVQALIPNGYAVVVADSRGTGASQGHREVDFSLEELRDFGEIMDWVKRQWWCNGELGMGGISYDGMAGLQAAAMGGVKAAVTLFTPMDVIADLLAPGGMVCSSFVRDYVGLTAMFEEEGTPLKHHLNYPWHYPLHVILGFLVTFGGALPVDRNEEIFAKVLREHEKNWDMGKVVQQVEYLDDNITLADGRTLPVVSFGITEKVMEGLGANNVSVYIAGGYCDSAIVRGSSRLFDYMKKHAPESKPKLVLGPWTHSGRRSCSPYIGNYPCFEYYMYLDLVRYLDCHLKGKCWGGILEEPPVRYWQVGEERWKTSESYPPSWLEYRELHLSNQPLGADLRPLETEVPEGIVMVNETVIRELRGGEMHNTESECDVEASSEENVEYYKRYVEKWSEKTQDGDMTSLKHVIHDITQLTYIQFKRAGAHHLHHYHRAFHPAGGFKWPPHSLKVHSEFLAKDSYVLKPKAVAYATAAARQSRRTFSTRRGSPGKPSNIERGARGTSTTHDVVSFKVDYQATTGIFSRWLIAQHPFRMAIDYGNLLFPSRAAHPMRQRLQEGLLETRNSVGGDSAAFSSRLSFTTAELLENVVMVGSPWVKFSAYVSGCTEVSLFVYLEDVDLVHGYSHYVTEGKVVASHRVTEGGMPVPVGSPDVVYRSFMRKDYLPVQGSELVEMSLTLEPVSWTFLKGHAIRVSMGGADVDNFELRDHAGILPVLPDRWQIIVNDPANFPAWVRLPVQQNYLS